MSGYTQKLTSAGHTKNLENKMEVTFPAGKSGMIAVYDGLLAENWCSSLIQKLQPVYDLISFDGQTMDGVQKAIKRTSDLPFVNMELLNSNGLSWESDFKKVDEAIVEGIKTALSHYMQQYRSLHSLVFPVDSGFNLQRYTKNEGFYREHVDCVPWDTSSNNRILAAIVYLNTVEHGGHTNFPLHEVSVAPVVGRIVLFPTAWTHPHEGCPSFSEDRWLINTFIMSGLVDSIQPNNTPLPQNNDHDHFDPTDEFEWQETGVENGQ
jgi:hypothetical protein